VPNMVLLSQSARFLLILELSSRTSRGADDQNN